MKTLSESRAFTVMEYLIAKGVPAARLAAQGLGRARPLSPARTDEARARNRRVQFDVIAR